MSIPQILVVEDDKFLREMLVSKLRADNFNTLEAVNAREARSIMEAEHPQAVLLDLILPDSSGFELLEWIKTDPGRKNIPVIILSNLGSEDDVTKGLQLGANNYIIKSDLNPSEIITKLNQAIEA